MNGKGDSPRNCFSQQYKQNYDKIFSRSDKPCAFNGCNKLIDRGSTYCEEHQPKFGKKKWPQVRMPKGWGSIRKQFLLSQPLPIVCAMCAKTLFSPKDIQVDHIKARKHGGTNDFSNLQCLCRSCHTSKTMQGN